MLYAFTITSYTLSGADPGCLKLLEDGQKSKYFIRTVKFLQFALIEQSTIQASNNIIVTLIEQSNISTEATSGSTPDYLCNYILAVV